MASLTHRGELSGERSAAFLPLAEAHHRIANSLEVIGSLVQLQGRELIKRNRSLTPHEAQRILDEVAARIATVALLHRLLSRTPSQDVIDLGFYLRQVCEGLVGALAYGGQVELSGLEDGFCRLRADRAVPLAVLLNELVTNAFKYGERCGSEHRIVIACRHEGDDQLVLEISDNGCGLPEGFDPDRDGGLGLRVVRALAGQLAGRLDFRSAPHGLTVRLEIPSGPELAEQPAAQPGQPHQRPEHRRDRQRHRAGDAANGGQAGLPAE